MCNLAHAKNEHKQDQTMTNCRVWVSAECATECVFNMCVCVALVHDNQSPGRCSSQNQSAWVHRIITHGTASGCCSVSMVTTPSHVKRCSSLKEEAFWRGWADSWCMEPHAWEAAKGLTSCSLSKIMKEGKLLRAQRNVYFQRSHS